MLAQQLATATVAAAFVSVRQWLAATVAAMRWRVAKAGGSYQPGFSDRIARKTFVADARFSSSDSEISSRILGEWSRAKSLEEIFVVSKISMGILLHLRNLKGAGGAYNESRAEKAYPTLKLSLVSNLISLFSVIVHGYVLLVPWEHRLCLKASKRRRLDCLLVSGRVGYSPGVVGSHVISHVLVSSSATAKLASLSGVVLPSMMLYLDVDLTIWNCNMIVLDSGCVPPISSRSTTPSRDKWRSRWALDKDEEFTVKELARLLEEKILHIDSGDHETIWNKLVHKQVSIFVWTSLKGRLSVSDNIQSIYDNLDIKV
ncbi:hypothetical protein Tco_0778099 [Tanacetum coccineum]